jgi:hypothetical protein
MSGQAIEVNTASGAVTLTLPAAPIPAMCYHIKDIGSSISLNQLIINPNGKNIEGLSNNYTVYANGWDRILFYDGTSWWLM